MKERHWQQQFSVFCKQPTPGMACRTDPRSDRVTATGGLADTCFLFIKSPLTFRGLFNMKPEEEALAALARECSGFGPEG